MSKNISKLSGRIGLKDNLFQKLSEMSLNSKNGEVMKVIGGALVILAAVITQIEKLSKIS